jgi:hypothetical protein
MFSVGHVVHLWNPATSRQRVLVSGKVEQILDGGAVVVARFEEPIGAAAGANVQVYAEMRGKFYQQGATVRAVPATDAEGKPIAAETPVVELQRVGEPVSAESRGSYRVATTISNIFCTLTNDAKTKRNPLQVVDVSPEGFAILMPAAPSVGTMLAVRWEFAGIVVEGPARVQTIKQTRGGSFRVGLLLPDRASPARKAIEKASVALQRDQLRRASRAA